MADGRSHDKAITLKVGRFQTLDFPAEDQVVVHDEIHGNHIISEPVLVELLQSAPLRRLIGVCQHGISGLLDAAPPVTRFEHSVGAFLLVRQVEGSVEEQVAALLHDVSHTAFSHVADWALSKPGEDSFHEVHKDRYVHTTDLPAILARHGFADPGPLREELYPLVEMPAPHLCADRLDYGLRDAVGFGKLTVQDARSILRSLAVFPDPRSPSRLLVLRDEKWALALAHAYLRCDSDVWCNPAHMVLYQTTGQLMGGMVRSGSIPEQQLWTLSDADFWARMRESADPRQLLVLDSIEADGLPDPHQQHLPKAAKIRTIDPDVWTRSSQSPCPLSDLDMDWKEKRRRYVLERQRLRVL